jgi:carnitine O-acetyltransferase
MEEWWLRMAYLMTRETQAVHVNWFGVFPDWGVKLSPVQAAALMMVSTLEFKDALDRQKLPPETMRGAPLCMYQYSRIFGTTRIPQEGEDILETHSDSRHVAVFRNDHIFTVTPYHPDGTMFSVAEVAAVLQQVLDLSSSVLEETEEPSVSVLTSANRDKWAAVRTDMMERSALNRDSIRAIETALYCMSFEESSPASKQEVAHSCFAGDGRGKWFDKSFTTLVFDNGRGGCNAEHSPVDAMVCVSMFDYVVKRTRDKVILEKAHLYDTLPKSAVPAPTKLKFELWPALSMAIETASVELTQLISDVSVRVFKFKHFGKAFIKNYKMHPV